MSKLRVLLLPLCLILTACAIDPPARAPLTVLAAADPRQAALLDAFETLFRHQFKRNASGVQQHGPSYYLAIDEKDPTPAFLARFGDLPKPVLPGSQFSPGDGRLLFSIHSARWIDDDTLEIHGGYYEGNLSSSGNTYRLHRANHQWTVTSDTMNWIS